MKKEMILTFVIAMSLGLSSNVSAFSESFDGPITDSSSLFKMKKDSNSKLNSAIMERWYSYQKNKARDADYGNRLTQIQRHNDGKKSISVNGESTLMKRDGNLKFVPFYKQIRSSNKSTINAPNNSKRNFRTRAINYYIDGGNAGTDVLKSNVILDSEHTIPQIPFALKREKKQAIDYYITKPIRDVLKFEMKTTDQVPAGEQKTTFRRGDFSRNLFHPFMFGTPSTTSVEKSTDVFFSTEAE
jgi:hypothetical protein